MRKKYEFYFGWSEAITQEEWSVYQKSMTDLREAGVNFMIGGGFAQAIFTGRWRDTKDIDLYILPEDQEKASRIITQVGLEDYFARLPYDRRWIYRGVKGDVIVDLIWAMANQRAQVDEIWVKRAGRVEIRGCAMKVVPIEEFLWCKLYIVQRDRCDWVDVMNLLYFQGCALDYEHLLWRLGEDWPLLQGVLTVFGWLHPERAQQFQGLLPEPLKVPQTTNGHEKTWEQRVRLLDSREWFGGLLSKGEQLEI